MLNNFLSQFRSSVLTSGSGNRQRTRTRRFRGYRAPLASQRQVLQTEALEQRALLTAFVVNTIEDGSAVADGAVSLREAITAANTNMAFLDAPAGETGPGTVDTISFDPSLNGQTITLNGTALTISDDLMISDSNAVPIIVDAADTSGVFEVASGANDVSISDLTITGGNAVRGAGLLIATGESVTLTSVTISGNDATGDAATDGGGGIYNDGGTLTVVDSTVTSNSASGVAGSGGGIFSTSGDVTLTSTNIQFNEANRAGGGIELIEGSALLTSVNLLNNDVDLVTASPGNGGGVHITGAADITLDGGSVFGNLAGREGGGLWNGTGTMTILNGTLIQGNEAGGDAADDGGGGIFNNGGQLVIDGSASPVQIVNNVAFGILGSGGAIFNAAGGVTTITDATISGNEAERAGGAIEDASAVAGVVGLSLTNVTLDGNSVFGTDATAPGNGGALHVTGAGDVNISGGVVSNNFAALEGGGLWNGSGLLSIDNGTTIDSNTASGAAADEGGGGIFNNGGSLEIDGSASIVTISNNVADGAAGSGGGIFSTSGDVTLTSTNIQFNEANRAGGGIELIEGNALLTSVNLLNNDVDLVTASPGNGGGVHITGAADITLDGGSVFGNLAGREGGGLWNGTGTMTILNGTLIQGNEAGGDAADDGGGGIFNNGGQLVIDGSASPVQIVNNVAFGILGSGGAIFNAAGGVTTITDTTISGNEAERAGGAIEDASAVAGVVGLSLTNVTLDGNSVFGTDVTAPGNGGALHISGGGSVDILNSTVSGNTAALEGGGLWNSGSGTLTVVNATIAANVAETDGNGGGIFTVAGGQTILTNTIVAGNTSGNVSTADDVAGPLSLDSQYNLISDTATSGGLLDGVNFNNVGVDGAGTRDLNTIVDSTLADNGGSTLTHAIVTGSAAIDAGLDLSNLGVVLDQAGQMRPQGNGYDIGALESAFSNDELASGSVSGQAFVDENGDGARLPQSVVDLQLFAQDGRFFTNVFGAGANWYRSAIDNAWHFIRPDGTLVRWDGTASSATGTIVAQLNTRFHRDEFLLTEAATESSANGVQFELVNSVGSVVAVVTSADADLNNDNTIDPATESGVYLFEGVVPGNYSVRQVNPVGTVQSAGPASVDAQLAFDLDQARDFNYTGNFFTNFGNLDEHWFRQTGGWAYITPDGSVFTWTPGTGGNGGPLQGELIAKLDPIYHASPQLLFDAVNPVLSVAETEEVEGPDFGNYETVTISGRFFEDANQDGIRNDGEKYLNGRRVELIDRDGNVVRRGFSSSVDANDDQMIDANIEVGVYEFSSVVPGQYSLQQTVRAGEIDTAPFPNRLSEFAFELDQRLRLNISASGNLFEDFGGNQERWLFSGALAQWTYLTQQGELFVWDGTSRGDELTGSRIAKLDSSFYDNPELLYNAQTTKLRVESGDRGQRDFGLLDVDRLFMQLGSLLG